MPKCEACGHEWESRVGRNLRYTKEDFKAIGRIIKSRKIPKTKKSCKACDELQLEILNLKSKILSLEGDSNDGI
jgi:hypothetical protein